MASSGIITLEDRDIGTETPIVGTHMTLHLVGTSSSNTWILSIIYNSQKLIDQNLFWETPF